MKLTERFDPVSGPFYAAASGHPEVARFLLEKTGGKPDIFVAICLDDLDRVKAILENESQKLQRGHYSRTPLQWTARFGRTNIADFLVRHYSEAQEGDRWKEGALSTAAQHGQIEMMRLLLKRGFDVNGSGEDRRPLLDAVEHGRGEVVDFLLKHGASPNIEDSSGKTALHYACREGERELAELFISKGIDVNSADARDRRPLHMAAYRGHVEIVKLCLQHGADVNATDSSGNTALHMVNDDDAEVADLLLAHGADPNISAANGWSAYEWALVSGEEKVAKKLEEGGARPTIFSAAMRGDVKELHRLMAGGARPQRRDNHGRGPLHWAVRRGHKDGVELLLLAGANPRARTADGKTPLDLADDPDIRKVLKEEMNKR